MILEPASILNLNIHSFLTKRFASIHSIGQAYLWFKPNIR